MKCQKCGTEISGNIKFCPKCGTKVETTPTASAGSSHDISKVWPEWQIEGAPIGRGSYGVVYRAIRKDNNVESRAAIKVISIPSDASEIDSLRSEGLDIQGTTTYFKGIVDDFVNEIQLMESFKGVQNIVSVEDYKVIQKVGTIGWDIYIRMELLTPFNNYICDKNLTEADIIKIGCDICTALEICGQRNVIHRDIKPENIFINDFGYFKLGDFGIARKLENMTGGLSQKGTYNYIAPEVVNGSNYDSRVDTYSLGIVLYRLLNGNKLPFLNNEKQLLSPVERKKAVDRRIRGEAIPAPCNASQQMANLILKACAFDPQNRFTSASEMKQALISVSNGTYHTPAPVRPIEENFAIEMTVQNVTAPVVPLNNTAQFSNNTAPVVNRFDEQPQLTNNSKVKEPKKKQPMSKGKKAKIIIISILVVILAAAIALGVSFLTSSAFSVYNKLNSDEFSTALTLYRSGIKGDTIEELYLKLLLDGRDAEVLSEFNSGTIDFEAATEELNALTEMGFASAKEQLKQASAINDSANALEKADKFYADGDYSNAIAEYSKILETDENYQTAQNKISEICPQYISSVVSIATNYNNAGQYKDALTYINTAYGVLPAGTSTTELDSIKAESLALYKTDISTSITTYISNESYSEAFTLLNEAISFTNDQYFKDLKSTTESDYVDKTIADVDALLAKNNYTEALVKLKDATAILPQNTVLKDKLTKTEAKRPVSLSTLTPINGGWTWNEGTPTDPFGKTYSNVCNYVIFTGTYNTSNYYAEYRLYGKHKTISGSLISYTDVSEKGKSQIKIYADDVLVYTSPEIERKTDLINFEVNINNADYIKIEVTSTTNGDWGTSAKCLLLMDCQLWAD